jgi:hypothetical protein
MQTERDSGNVLKKSLRNFPRAIFSPRFAIKSGGSSLGLVLISAPLPSWHKKRRPPYSGRPSCHFSLDKYNVKWDETANMAIITKS